MQKVPDFLLRIARANEDENGLQHDLNTIYIIF